MRNMLFSTLYLLSAGASALTLYGTSLHHGDAMPPAQQANLFGCTGQNLSPALFWDDVPAGTQSFAISMHDPDAPTGSGFWHWMIVNLPADTRTLAAGVDARALPVPALVLKNDLGQANGLGSCPPQGRTHRYRITIHALDSLLDIDAQATPALAGFMIHQHELARAEMMLIHKR